MGTKRFRKTTKKKKYAVSKRVPAGKKISGELGDTGRPYDCRVITNSTVREAVRVGEYARALAMLQAGAPWVVTDNASAPDALRHIEAFLANFKIAENEDAEWIEMVVGQQLIGGASPNRKVE